MSLTAADAHITAGGNGTSAQIGLFPANATNQYDLSQATLHMRASDGIIRAGRAGVDGTILVLNEKNAEMVPLEGKTGDLLLYNADLGKPAVFLTVSFPLYFGCGRPPRRSGRKTDDERVPGVDGRLIPTNAHRRN